MESPNNILPKKKIIDKAAIKQKRVFEKFSGNRPRCQAAAGCLLIFSFLKLKIKIQIREVML